MRDKLFVDLGHSVKFPGASGVKKETDWNRAVAKFLPNLINQNKWEVIMVPTDYLTDWSANRQLINRINWINKRATAFDHLISLHGNAATNPTARGVYTVYMGGYESMRNEAIKLSKAYSAATGVPLCSDGSFDDRHGRFGRIGMVRDTDPVALLIEMGFVTNAEDMKADPMKAAQGIADYYNALK